MIKHKKKLQQKNQNISKKISLQYIHHHFEKYAQAKPKQSALIFGNLHLNYDELNKQANQLARYLVQLDIKPGNHVGIMMERSPKIIVSILAVLKAGGVYALIDPHYPDDRKKFMLINAKIKFLLTQKLFIRNYESSSIKIVAHEEIEPIITKQKNTNFSANITPDNLACIVYTSGTTGFPKGVMITHKNMCEYINSMRKTLNITHKDRYLHTASVAFSSSNRQLFLPLFSGATVILSNKEDRMDPVALFKLIQSQKVSIIDLVPSHWRSCINALLSLKKSALNSLLKNNLRMVLSASETLSSDIPHLWRRKLQQKTKLINMYGLTEISGIATTYLIPNNKKNKTKTIPIGHCIPGVQAYILNNALQPITNNEQGLLYIGGATVTQGYLNNSKLTKEKFISNPFNKSYKIFKTGDICRYSTDGSIEYIGREDNQIKIRGFRIEAREIEIIINQHPYIQESVVVAKKNYNEKQLVAYFVENKNTTILENELRMFVKKSLPEYMIPAHFIKIDSLPLTPHGKINRIFLTNLKTHTPIVLTAKDNQLAKNSTEKNILEIWKKILGVTKINPNSNFFELGGNSLNAHRVILELNKKYKLNLSISIFFQNPSIAQLNEQVEKHINSLNAAVAKNREQGRI